eukprot:jgi/Mesen1/2403/ME000157S01540
MWQPPTSPLKGYKLCTVLVLLACLAAPQHAASQEVAQPTRRAYIVLMNDLPPAAAYKGRFEDYARTAPARRGQKLNCSEGAVVRYSDFLGHEHSHALQACGRSSRWARTLLEVSVRVGRKRVRNRAVVEPCVSTLCGVSDRVRVLACGARLRRSKATTRTPDLLNLRNTLWRANSVKGPSGAGEGVVIGVIDSGALHACPYLTDFPKSSCNGKLIGAKYFVRGFQSSDSVSGCPSSSPTPPPHPRPRPHPQTHTFCFLSLCPPHPSSHFSPLSPPTFPSLSLAPPFAPPFILFSICVLCSTG